VEFTNIRDILLKAMQSHEVPASEAEPCTILKCVNLGVFDCPDCDAPGLYCRSCAIECHKNVPFHRPRKWNGRCYTKTSLRELGLVYAMGHSGMICPYTKDDGGMQDITVKDINGLHCVKVAWCRCENAPSMAEQLLSRRLVPATSSRPRTAFTFRVLNFFQILNHTAYTSPWSFSATIHRLTDNVLPDAVPVSITEL
jgi:hypothetical protein